MLRTAINTTVFFFLAPGTMGFVVPWWIAGWQRPGGTPGPLDVTGFALVAAGLAAVVACFTRFVREGRGTPAPVAPTEFLVLGGLYRYVRNPMYLAVATIIGGNALVLHSTGVLAWLAVFVLAVWSFVHGYEEPTLTEQFGESYSRYRAAVPGWWPRLTPYQG